MNCAEKLGQNVEPKVSQTPSRSHTRVVIHNRFLPQTLSSINTLLEKADQVYRLLVQYRNDLDHLLITLSSGPSSSRMVRRERGREGEQGRAGGMEGERERGGGRKGGGREGGERGQSPEGGAEGVKGERRERVDRENAGARGKREYLN